jgi:hypothetical protein
MGRQQNTMARACPENEQKGKVWNVILKGERPRSRRKEQKERT